MQTNDTHPPSDPQDDRPYGRRAFLGMTALGLSSLVWGRPVWDRVARTLSPAASVLPGSVRDAVSPGWRIYTVAARMPTFDARTWRLSVDGLVDRPLALTYAALQRLPRVEQTSDFHCVTGWSVTGVRWAGVRFADLLRLAGPRPAATAIEFVSSEVPYTDTLTIDQALLPDVLLAYEMDGQPLSRPHGAPVRVVIPDMYGYKNVKWVERIVLVSQPRDGYWERRGYDRNAWVGRSNGR